MKVLSAYRNRVIVSDLKFECLSPSQLSQSQSAESLRRKAVFKLGTHLVQVARNSLLDKDSLRTYLKNLKAKYLEEVGEGGGETMVPQYLEEVEESGGETVVPVQT